MLNGQLTFGDLDNDQPAPAALPATGKTLLERLRQPARFNGQPLAADDAFWNQPVEDDDPRDHGQTINTTNTAKGETASE